ncbi:alpha-amylase 2-like isoform X2 [Phymastichus coffea]|uniref:alpha-amylase 2-like isoform X2 n=1 Tax=Phymastichus coffea TaxID=108790 RepID=UPI00273C8B46|nr:alpha-amylase 2-like isoform X2 [Phymastichus coffea]
MVHLFEWKWKDIAEECERFLGPMGFAGVQVSPISENLIIENRPWYERYQPISYKIITRSGNESEFKDMVARCNTVGVRIYVDVVINHMTGDADPAIGTGGSIAEPKKRLYPAVPFGPDDFNNPCGINDYNNGIEVRNCDLSGLHDLNQGKEYVREKIVEFLNHAIELGVAGFRVDAAKHMWPGDLEAIYGRLKVLRSDVFGANERPFIFQEVIDLSGGEGVNKREYNRLGCVIEFSFGIQLGRIFRGWAPMRDLRNWGFQDRGLLPTRDVIAMIDNHDNQRGHGAGGNAILNYKAARLYKMAVAFMLAHPYGHPRIMSSFDFANPSQGPPADNKQNILSPDPITGDLPNGADANFCGHGWVCEHRWSPIYGMVGFRNVVQDSTLIHWWSNGGNQIVKQAIVRGRTDNLTTNLWCAAQSRQPQSHKLHLIFAK